MSHICTHLIVKTPDMVLLQHVRAIDTTQVAKKTLFAEFNLCWMRFSKNLSSPPDPLKPPILTMMISWCSKHLLFRNILVCKGCINPIRCSTTWNEMKEVLFNVFEWSLSNVNLMIQWINDAAWSIECRMI